MYVPLYVWVSIATVLIVAAVAGIAKAADPHPTKLNGKALYAVQQYIDSAIKLQKQAEQDADLQQRMTDICFAMAYVNAGRILATDVTIEDKCGVKVDELHATLRAQQQQCLSELENK